MKTTEDGTIKTGYFLAKENRNLVTLAAVWVSMEVQNKKNEKSGHAEL